MSSTDNVIDCLRPTLSAMRPNIQPPMGRIRNPRAKMPAVCSNCAVASPEGKNDAEKYRENAEKTYQSYHSTRLPTEPLKMALSRRCEMRSGRVIAAEEGNKGGERSSATGLQKCGEKNRFSSAVSIHSPKSSMQRRHLILKKFQIKVIIHLKF
jgi:hypothetical protein